LPDPRADNARHDLLEVLFVRCERQKYDFLRRGSSVVQRRNRRARKLIVGQLRCRPKTLSRELCGQEGES